MIVILSLTTIPTRCHESALKPVIISLLQQTYSFDKLVLTIPVFCVRKNMKYPNMTAEPWFQKMQEQDRRLELLIADRDWGPATKVIPAMRQFGNTAGVIISVDDDVILEKHTVEELMAAHKQSPNAVLGMMGATGDTFFHAETIPSKTKVDCLGGYRGILYPVKSTQIFASLFSLLHDAHVQSERRPVIDDDYAFQRLAELCGLPRFVVPTKYPDPRARFNFRFIENKDGVSGGNEGSILGNSRTFLAKLFQKHLIFN